MNLEMPEHVRKGVMEGARKAAEDIFDTSWGRLPEESRDSLSSYKNALKVFFTIGLEKGVILGIESTMTCLEQIIKEEEPSEVV